MVVVGVQLRVARDQREAVRSALGGRRGMEPFEVPDPDHLGLILEVDSLARAHELLREDLTSLPGVLTAWPVHVELDADQDEKGC